MRKFRIRALYFVLFILICSGAYVSAVKIFAIRQIQVTGTNMQLTINRQKFPPTLLFFPSEHLRTQMLADNPVLSDIRFEKRYPGTLIIIPTVRPIAALLVTPSRRVYIDNEAFVVADADGNPKGMVQVAIPLTGLRLGQHIADKRVSAVLLFITGVKTIVPIETVVADENGDIRARTGTLDILFTQDSDIPLTLATLQTALTGFRIKGTLPRTVDLRFDKPVITF